jgi:hypothetical protein
MTDFDLHSLGWKAFQDLCATIVRELLGQTVEQFFESNDGGRDGAFRGVWHPQKGESLEGTFTVQCKFTSKRDKQLAAQDLKEEIEKASRLAERGLAENYVLMTNAHLTGTSVEKIQEQLLSIKGIKQVRTYGRQWIIQVIAESSRLRMLVPRLYGLGDLTQILDERAYSQATELLASLGDDLAKFVITNVYRQSAKALVDHGFVLLLGEPAAGKSTIAAALAVAALDEWGCRTLKINSPQGFKDHWNPNEPKQFFWVDDAFGSTQFELDTATGWNRVLPDMHAAIRRGAKVLFTSRDYIYRAARKLLKESAFPLLTESQVIVAVEQLETKEREQILYNHIKLGRQPEDFRSHIKPFLQMISAATDFKPEIARRLGDPVFTRSLSISKDGVNDFVSNPIDHLKEVLATLDDGSRAALALVFMRGGSVVSPIELLPAEQQALQLLGGTISSVREAMNAMNGSLVLGVREGGRQRWIFKHPTIRDAFASLVAEDTELLDIYLNGAPPERLLKEVTCGDVGLEGVKVVVTVDRFEIIRGRFETLLLTNRQVRDRFYRFLTWRCSCEFLAYYVQKHVELIDQLQVWSFLDAVDDMGVIVRLHECGVLPEAKRKMVVEQIARLAVETPDAGFLDEKRRQILHEDELESILQKVKAELLPSLGDMISTWRGNVDGDIDQYFDPFLSTLHAYENAFADDAASILKLREAEVEVERTIAYLRQQREEDGDEDFYEPQGDTTAPATLTRSVFDDVDE